MAGHVAEPTEEEIERLIPFLRNTNPHMDDRQLKELARKMLSTPQAAQDFDLDKPLSELAGDGNEGNDDRPEPETESKTEPEDDF
jgi:hypothetical protein